MKMYQGKHIKRSHRRSGKFVALLVSLLLVACVTVGGTLAFLIAQTNSITNTFTPTGVTTSVEEERNGNTKSNVKIANTGETDAWIRATVVITWQDEEGNVYGQTPVAGTNYTAWTPGDDWAVGNDGFYYYTKPVAAKTSTATALIAEISPIGEPPADGYYLTVEIIASGLQSKPAEVFDTKWASSGLTVDDSESDPMNWTLIREVQE